jgi:sortase A
MKKHIGTILIVLGLVIIAFPFIGRLIADQRQKAMLEEFYLEVESYNEETAQAFSSLDSIFESTNTEEGQLALDESISEVPTNVEPTPDGTIELEKAGTIGKKLEVLGIIKIDKIDLKAPIAEGAELEILKYAIGHMESTTKLNTIGNSVIAGHRSHSFGVYFNRLDEMAIGDEIVVETPKEKVTYVIYDILMVEPDDVSVLRSSSKYRVLTLVTCDPVYNPTHRLIVHAIDKEQYTPK